MTVAASTNVEALVIFATVLSITLLVTYWASKRMTGAEAFWAAGRSIRGFQNGLAIGIVSMPLGFIGCWLGMMPSTERGNERQFAELHARSETGLGAEEGGGAQSQSAP